MSKLYLALLEVQKEIKPVKKTADNPFFHSKYADLEAVVEAVMPILSRNGIVCCQTTGINPTTGQPYLATALIHAETGDKVQGEMPIISKDSSDPQKVIAGVTYMRRAMLTTICGLATQDDDGNSASGNDKKPELKAYKSPMPKSQPSQPTSAPIDLAKVKEKVIEKLQNDNQLGAKKTITPTGVTFNSEAKELKFKVKTEKDGEYYTDKEVLAKLAKQNLNKPINVIMTVDAEFRNVLLDIKDAVPF